MSSKSNRIAVGSLPTARFYTIAAGACGTAVVAATNGSPYAREDDWMRPALSRAFWSATAAAGAILMVGVLALQLAIRQPRGLSRRPEGLPS